MISFTYQKFHLSPKYWALYINLLFHWTYIVWGWAYLIEIETKIIMGWLELEVRYGCMVLINILKSFIADDESWDTYGVMSSWNKFMLLSIVFFLLSFYSIQISFSTPFNIEVRCRYHNFNAIVFLSLFFSIILPQRACWPFLLLLWLSSYSALMKAVFCCFEAILS